MVFLMKAAASNSIPETRSIPNNCWWWCPMLLARTLKMFSIKLDWKDIIVSGVYVRMRIVEEGSLGGGLVMNSKLKTRIEKRQWRCPIRGYML